VEWYWQERTEELWEKAVPVVLCPPQIQHRLIRSRTWVFGMREYRMFDKRQSCLCRGLIYNLAACESISMHLVLGVSAHITCTPIFRFIPEWLKQNASLQLCCVICLFSMNSFVTSARIQKRSHCANFPCETYSEISLRVLCKGAVTVVTCRSHSLMTSVKLKQR
jgi:hypothetical protein